MSDTPRMKAANMAAMEHMTGDVWRVGCDIERELNAANDFNREIRERNEWLNDKIDAASQRIKRLEEAGDKLHWAWMNPFDPAGETIVNNWRKAKGDKL